MLMLRALTLVAVVGGVSVPLAQQIDQQIVPAVAPASTVGPCASVAIGITDDWCTDTCTQGVGAYCSPASCVCGEEAKAELAKPDRAINAAPDGPMQAPAPVAVPAPVAADAGAADTHGAGPATGLAGPLSRYPTPTLTLTPTQTPTLTPTLTSSPSPDRRRQLGPQP